MNNKNILIFLVILLVYVNVYMPLDEENRKLVHQITATEKSVMKDRYYLSHTKDIVKEVNQSNQINHLYEKSYFFQGESSQILNLMQKKIKEMIVANKVHEDLITWGEKYRDGKVFEIFPMQVRVSGSVKKLGDFFDSLYHFRKIKIKEFSMTRMPEHYILKISVFGVKRVTP